MRFRLVSLSLLIILFFISCFDLFTPTKRIDGNYYLSPSPANNGWTLYYDLGDGGHGRIDSVGKIGWTDKYIIAENKGNYYFLDKTKDEGLLNAEEIVIGPFGQDKFEKMLDSLHITNFKFDMQLDQ